MPESSTNHEGAWEFVRWATNQENTLLAQESGVIGARASAWEAEVPDTPEDLAEAQEVSAESGVGYSHPVVLNVSRARDIVGTAQSMADLGEVFDGGLTAAEVDYLRTEEWAVTAEDILWRRSKLGLRTSADSAARLTAYLDRKAEAA